jgi:hypothetical protein
MTVLATCCNRPLPSSLPPPSCPQAVRTVSVCRVLSLSRTAYMALVASFPLSSELMLDNLLKEAQSVRRGNRTPRNNQCTRNALALCRRAHPAVAAWLQRSPRPPPPPTAPDLPAHLLTARPRADGWPRPRQPSCLIAPPGPAPPPSDGPTGVLLHLRRHARPG